MESAYLERYFEEWKRWKAEEHANTLTLGAQFGFSLPDPTSAIELRHFGRKIDLSIVQTWRQNCHKFHGDCCNERYSDSLSQHVGELILIDVTQGRLLTLPSTTTYVALSYVWGKVPMLKTTKANLRDLQMDGALFDGQYGNAIPYTIRDTMHLLKQLGERYLWVDCLCIIQDAAPEELNKMLRAMGHIYASAEFTVVASRGTDAQHGLLGVGGPSGQRQPLKDWHDPYWPIDILESFGFAKGSKWIERGWTFQEALLSRRLLMFNDVISWVCGRLVHHECFKDVVPYESDTTAQDVGWPAERQHLGLPMGMMSLISKLPSLGRWGMLVQNYSTRQLTFEHDSIRAFAGATEIMGATFPGGILHGLPAFFFDIALLWQPPSRSRNRIERRPDQPSWSWTGWKGGIACWEWWFCHYAGIYRNTGHFQDWVTMAPLQSVATWDLVPSDAAMEFCGSHLNGFYKYQAIRDEGVCTWPPGWSRHEHEDGHYYTTNSGDGAEYRYNFPLPRADAFQPQNFEAAPKTILCTAPLATITFGWHEEPYRCRSSDLWGIGIHTERDVMSSTSKATFILRVWEIENITAGDLGQLLVLSEAKIERPDELRSWYSTRLCSPHHALPPFVLCPEPFYNVLWIEWKSNIAYRRALGLMSKREFDSLGAEIMTIRLG